MDVIIFILILSNINIIFDQHSEKTEYLEFNKNNNRTKLNINDYI